jgi:hypothetical protein
VIAAAQAENPINRNQIGFIELAYLVVGYRSQTEARPRPD